LLRLCADGRAFPDESLASESHPGVLRPLSAVPKLADALLAGRSARAARIAKAVPAVTEELRRAVVQIRTPTGAGTGFAIDGEGTIITNRHVVDDSTACTAHFDSGAISPGIVVFRSPQADFAIIRVAIPTPEFMCLSERRGDDVALDEPVDDDRADAERALDLGGGADDEQVFGDDLALELAVDAHDALEHELSREFGVAAQNGLGVGG
jgi:hypothetical protein